jgi:ABC-type phosphate/phosphonate transport system substrate-binding protein
MSLHNVISKVQPILLITVLILISGCKTSPPSKETLTLTIAVNDIYCTQTACFCVHDVAARDYDDTLARLRTDYGVDLKPAYFPEPYELEDAILTGTYDGVLSKPWLALRLQKQNGATYRRIADLIDPNDNRWLTGILIVPVDSPVTNATQLSGSRIYLGETDAYEKHYAAKHMLNQLGIVAGTLGTNASCSENIGVLQDEEADAAVISDYALSADCAVDFANPEDFRILAHTEKIPLTSLMIDMNRFTEEQADRIRQALLSVSGKEAADALLGNGFTEPAPWNPPELEP